MKKFIMFWVLCLGIFSTQAIATTLYRMPLSQGRIPFAWFDHDTRSGYFLRYDGNTTAWYAEHYGTDFNGEFGNGIWAGANGTVVYTHDGCPDDGAQGVNPTCGSSFGNNIRILHADGKVTVYAHMKLGSVAVSVGQYVLCSRLLGNVGNSGKSEGPHLHFEARNSTFGLGSDVAFDIFGGAYSNGGFSYWVNQNGGTPTTQCQ